MKKELKNYCFFDFCKFQRYINNNNYKKKNSQWKKLEIIWSFLKYHVLLYIYKYMLYV